MEPTHLSLLIALAVTALAALYDVRSWRIPNWLSLGTLAVAPIAHFAWGAATSGPRAGLEGAGWSIAGAALCGVVPWVCWRSGTFGGGDVKRLAWDGRLLRTLGASALLAINPLLPKSKRRALTPETMTPMRFAPAIAGGVILCALLQPS